MYHITMKHTLISIFFLSFTIFLNPFPTFAQTDDNGITYEENQQNNEDLKVAVDDIKTLKDTLNLTNDESTSTKLNFFQILVAIFAPLSFIAIAYLLIKRLKL